MRSLTADAAIIAGPSLAAAGGAILASERLFALAGEAGSPLPAALVLPTMVAIAFALTWAGYYLVVGLLAYRAVSTSNALVLFLLLVALLVVLALLNRPDWSVPMLASAGGAALALRLLRRRPRRQLSPN
jgi:small-conductance mechanosensitive channel